MASSTADCIEWWNNSRNERDSMIAWFKSEKISGEHLKKKKKTSFNKA